MKKNLLLCVILVIVIISGCTKKKHTYTTYKGTVFEQNSLNPIPNLQVTITDGTNIYSETVTNNMGQFSLDMAHNSSLGHLYIFIDGKGLYPSKNVDLINTEDAEYDYGIIYLYDQTNSSLYPQIENVTWDFPNGNNCMRFKDIAIISDYSLINAYVEIAQNDAFTQSKKYQLEKLANETYSVAVYDLIVGEQYYFQVVASNYIGTGKSEVYSRKHGFPIPSITELKSATVNSATIKMNILEEPLSTLSAGLCWSTSHNPSVNNNTQPGSLFGSSNVTIAGLDFRTTTYYVRAYAQNANGIAYSEELVLPVNNPYSLPTFINDGYTYTYKYLGWGSWYTAYNECTSFVDLFYYWILPDYIMMAALFNSYYSENGEVPPLPLWTRQRDEDLVNGQSETFMVTNNGNIWAPKTQSANYYAVRRF